MELFDDAQQQSPPLEDQEEAALLGLEITNSTETVENIIADLQTLQQQKRQEQQIRKQA